MVASTVCLSADKMVDWKVAMMAAMMAGTMVVKKAVH